MHNVFMCTRLPFLWFQDVTRMKHLSLADAGSERWIINPTSVTHFRFWNIDRVTCLIDASRRKRGRFMCTFYPWWRFTWVEIGDKRCNKVIVRFPCFDVKKKLQHVSLNNRQRMSFGMNPLLFDHYFVR